MQSLNDIIQKRSILAPLAGITDQSFRLIVKEFGATLMFTEMVSAEGLIRDSDKTYQLMAFSDFERPIGIQLFGSRPDTMAKAAKVVEKCSPEIIDLNFGCPAKKVVNGGSGSAILNDLQLLKAIVKSVVKAVNTPISCKIRSGWNDGSIVAVEAARIIEGEGASLLTLHPRTKAQGFSGLSDWNEIGKVKAAINIPVIGNGDIYTPQDAQRMLDETGCDAVMIGRGMMGRPWLCSHVDHYLATGEFLPEPSPDIRIQTCIKHYNLALKHLGQSRGVKEMRKQIGWYLKGMEGVSRIRSQLMIMEDPDKVKLLLVKYAAFFLENSANSSFVQSPDL